MAPMVYSDLTERWKDISERINSLIEEMSQALRRARLQADEAKPTAGNWMPISLTCLDPKGTGR